MRIRGWLLSLLAVGVSFQLAFPQTSFRKIVGADLPIQGISATVTPANPTIPKNTPAGVQIVVSTASGNLSSSDLAKFLGGPIQVTGELSGPGLPGAITLPQPAGSGGGTPVVDPLILPIPALTEAGNYTLTNLKILVNGNPALDINPSTVPLNVIDQVLITSVETTPLTLDQIKAAGVILDSSDFIGFQFTIGLATSSNVASISFPAVFDRNGVPLPQSLMPPQPPPRADVPVPTILPVMLNLCAGVLSCVPNNTPGQFNLPDGTPVQPRIPGVLVIPGDVGFLKQFFSAQLFVANGSPGGSGLVVHDVTGKINLPVPASGLTADDPLSLPDLHGSPQPATKPVKGVGPDGITGTADDVNALNPGDQGEAEFIIRGEKEGFYPISFDINGTLDGLATGSVTVSGTAQGGVLVRNPFFDMTFAVPSVVRAGETFTMFVTIKNISQATANLVTVSLDQGQLSGCTLIGATDQPLGTLGPGASKTISYTFKSLVTGQVVASYLHFDTTDGTTGALKFTLGVGERGVPLSPDTLALPSSVNNLPPDVVSAAMRVLGEGWSIASAPTGTLPSGVIRTSKAIVTQKGLALAEAGLRVQLGEQPQFALRDLLADFFGGNPIDPGFDQILRTTDAGQDFQRAVGAALAQYAVASGILSFQNDASNVLASGPDFISFALTNGSSAPPVTLTVTDGNGNVAQGLGSAQISDAIPGFAQAPLGTGAASPILGLLTSPTAFPYTLQFSAAGAGTFDVAVTMPHADGSFIRGTLSGVTVTQGLNSRIVLDISQPDRLILEQDTNNDGTYVTTQPLTTSRISASGPTLLTANVIDGATVPGASLLGVYAALLFDRVVDSNSAQQTANYQILSNAVQQAKPVFSGRVVVAALQQPEGPYVPTSISVSGIADARGVVGNPLNVPLHGNLLQDPGGVVTGHVLNADGTPVNNVVVTYSAYPNNDCTQEGAPPPLSAIPVDGNGRYQIRYVHQQGCGAAFKVATNDPNSGALREVNSFIRFGGEQLVVDLTLLGRGNVSGTVRDTNGVPQSGATVVVLSQTDLQVGAQTTTDGNGQYSVSGITVGPVTVQAAKGVGLGHSAGNIARAGTTATVDVTLDTGAISVSGTLYKQVNGGKLTAVPNFPIAYGLDTNPFGLPPAQAVVNTDGNGNFVFTAVPEGAFVVFAQLTVTDFGISKGTAIAGTAVTGFDVRVKIDDTSFGAVNGNVFYPDNSPAAGVAVLAPGGAGVLTDANGAYSLPGIPIRSTSQTISAQTGDGLRQGTAKVLVTQAGQVVNNVNITLSGLGTAQFTVLDATGKPVAGQAVALTFGCNSSCGCNPVQVTTTSSGVTVTSNPLVTDAQGVAVWPTLLPVGSVGAIAISSTHDVASGTAFIPGDKQTGSGVIRFAGAGTVTGLVTDPDGRPSFGATLALRANVFDPLSCSLIPGDAASVQTDTSGNFNFNGVHAGPVAVTASQVFFPAPVGKQGVLANAQTLNLSLQLVNTTAGVFSGTVFLPDGVTPAGAGVQVTASGALPDVTVSTDANSHFQFAKIFPGGGYTVTVRDPASGGVAQDSVFLPPGQNGNPPPDVTHNFRLKGKGTVTVQVVDGSNQPVTNATVTLTENSFPNAVHEGEIQPANQGVVTLTDVFEGPFSVSATDNVGRGGRTSNTLPGPGASVAVTVQLTSTGTVQGHFFMPDGVTGIPFASVSLSANGRQIGQVTTDSADAGFYSFTFVPAGPVLLQAQDPVTGRTGVASGTIVKDGQTLPLDVIAEGLGTVKGIVTLNGASQAGADVDIFSGNYHAATVTDSTGHYMVSGVPVGHIVVNAGFTNNFLLGTNSATLPADGSTIEIDVALRGSGSIQGTVVQSDQKTPAAGAVVTVAVGGQGGGSQSVSADANGNFTFSIVPEGIATLNATFGDIDRGQLVVDVPAGSPVTPAPTVTLNGVGSISGHTQDGLGNNIAGHLTITGTGAFPYTFAIDTNPDGFFQLPEVLAGNFTASLTVTNGTITTSGTVFSSVTPNANTDVVVPLQATGAVKGIVLRSDGVTPATGANVTISVGAGHSIVVQAQTDGSFNASGIPLGAFTVSINDPVSTGQALIQGQSLTTAGQTFDLDTLFPPVNRIVLNDTPMAALSITPADGTSGLTASLTSIVVTFSNPLSSTAGIHIVSAKQGTLSLPFTLTPDGKVATFTGLPSSDQITVTATTDVTDTLGRHPLQPLTSTFFVGPPDVVSITPLANQNQIATDATITVNFREPLAAGANLSNLIVLSSASGPVTGTTALATPTQAVFTPAAALPTDTMFTVTVNGATDLGGNVQTVPFTSSFASLDTIPPVVQLASPANGGLVNAPRPTISFSATDSLTGVDFATGSVTLDSQLVATGTLSFTPSSNLSEGLHNVSASVKDRAGNLGGFSGSFTVDTQPPSAATVSGVTVGQVLSGVVPLSLSATDATSGVAFIDLLVDDNFFTRTSAPFQVSLNTSALLDGNHTLRAKATDAAGNVGPAGPAVSVVFNNVHLTVSFTAPAAGTPFNNQFTVTAGADKSVQRIDFSFAGQSASATVAPYNATFSVVGLADGPQTVTATATDFAGNSASATLTITVDRTPPAAPNANLINAEPPVNGFSQVHGLVGSVEAFDTVSITNLTHAAQATASVASDGTFSTNIAGSVDDTLSLTAIDAAGNQSGATLITVRRTPSVPPASGNTSLTFAGDLVDRVGTAPGALSPDGSLDAVFTMNIDLGAGVSRTLSRVDISNGSTTHSAASGTIPVGVAADVSSPFLNHADGSLSSTFASGVALTLITSDNGFIQPGLTYTATATFTDGSKFVGTFLLVAPADQLLAAHAATIVANPPAVVTSAGAPGTSTITVTNIRDINGTLLPDGSKIALSAANAATQNGSGTSIPSAGGSFTDGVPAANNTSFKIYTIQGGSVTATYSSQPISPPAITGAVAVVQMLAADSASNVLGTEVVATQDINVRLTSDQAVVGASPGSLYADTADRRSHITVQVTDGHGNPVPDGTPVGVTVGDQAAFTAGFYLRSAGGTIIGGSPSANGSQYSIFTTTAGSFQFDYSSAGVSSNTNGSSNVVIAVLQVFPNSTSLNLAAIGTGNITLVGLADAETNLSMSSTPLVSPAIPLSIVIHDVHDTRGNLVPDGANLVLSANDQASIINGFFVRSAGGTIVDGLASPSGNGFRSYSLAQNQVAATYDSDGAGTTSPGSTAIANVQLCMGDPSGHVIDIHALKALPITLVPPSNAVVNAQPSSVLGDGAIHTSTVTFAPVLDAFGNPLPDGTKLTVSARDQASIQNGFFVRSAGGQILSGTPSPTSGFMVETVQGGGVTVTYADQNVTATPGQLLTANVQLVEAKADGSTASINVISVAPVTVAGLTSATFTVSPAVVLADGGDRRVNVTITNLKDAAGNKAPDGTLVAVSAADQASILAGFFVRSAGGTIIGGTTAAFSSAFQIFPVVNGQVVLQYSSQGISLTSGQQATANVQLLPVSAAGQLISSNNVGLAAIQLEAPGSASIGVSPSDVFSDGGVHSSAITIANLKEADGTTPIPDGARIGLSVVDQATIFNGFFVRSAGGQVLSAGVTAGDGTPATNSAYDLFTVAGGQVLATYTDSGLFAGTGKTLTANIQLIPAAANGSVVGSTGFAVAPVQVHGIASTTANGPATLSQQAGSVLVTFSGIKDSGGHLVPDGTLVLVTAADQETTSGGFLVRSTGGTIVDGNPSPSSTAFKVFVVQNGSVTVTYSPAGASLGTANIQITGAQPDGRLIDSIALSGGVLGINITN